MPKSIIIKNGGPEVLELKDAKIKLLGPNEIKLLICNWFKLYRYVS